LLQHELFRLGTRILLGDVEEAGVGRRVEANLDAGRLGHDGLCAGSENSEACLDRAEASESSFGCKLLILGWFWALRGSRRWRWRPGPAPLPAGSGRRARS